MYNNMEEREIRFRIKKAILTKTRYEQDLVFLIRCRKENVIPNFIKIRKKNKLNFEIRILEKAEKIILGNYIRHKRAMIAEKNLQINFLEVEISKFKADYTRDRKIEEFIVDITKKKVNNHTKKIRELMDKKARKSEKSKNFKTRNDEYICKEKFWFDLEPPKLRYEPTVEEIEYINFSSLEIDGVTDRALKRGSKFVYPDSKTNNKVEQIASAENIICNLPKKWQEQSRFEVARVIRNKGRRNKSNWGTYKEEIEQLEKIRNNEQVKITRADKTNQFVLIKSEKYREKMKEEIEKLKCVCLKKDPTQGILRKLRNFKNHSHLPVTLKKACVPPIGYRAPDVLTRVKIHKEFKEIPPFRIIVAKCTAPTVKVERALANFLKPLLKYRYTVDSSIKAFEKLKNFKFENRHKCCSFDVVDLYPSVPIDRVQEIIEEKLRKEGNFEEIVLQDVIELLKFIMKNSYFRYEEKFFKQIRGAPMGSPLSGILSEFILQELEENIIEKIQENENEDFLWIRYVDDILCVYNDNTINIEELKDEINNFHSSINFTVEKENESKINFLDILILRGDQGIKCTVYRKDTFRPICIPYNSTNSFGHKMAFFRAYFTRMFKICSTIELIRQELVFIYGIAMKAGYPRKVINKIFYEVKRSIMNDNNTEDKNINKRKFIGSVQCGSQIMAPLRKKLKKCNLEVAEKKGKDLYSRIQNCKHKTKEQERTGVYRIYVDQEGERSYIGSTIRPLQQRIREHVNDVKERKESTALSRLAKNESISPRWGDTKIIDSGKNEKTIRIKEAIHIYKNRDNVINDADPLTLSYAWKWVLDEYKL